MESIDKAALEIEKLTLENRLLKLELKERSEADLWKHLSRMAPSLATLLAVAGFVFGIAQYAIEQSANRKSSDAQAQRDVEARDREFMKPLWEKELELYMKASEVAAIIATSKDAVKRQAAEAEFWTLYEGPLIIVESKSLSRAMVNFGNCLNKREPCSGEELVRRSRALASTMQVTIQEAANMRLSEFSQNKFQYHH